MKIIEVTNPKPKFKTVNFHGVEFNNVPNRAIYVSADADGAVYVFVDIPNIATTTNEWFTEVFDCEKIGEVDLEGMDWRDTLVKI